MVSYYTLSRTALKVGLYSYGYSKGQIVLIPDYLCNAITDTLESMGLIVVFYNLNSRLSPNWESLTRLVKESNPVALLMVHYFGQPQDISRFQKICRSEKILLIEDNAHGFGGYYNKQLLGTFGDIGFSSPRKFQCLSDGGCLHYNYNTKYSKILDIQKYEFNIDSSRPQKILERIKQKLCNYTYIYSWLQSINARFNDYSNPYYFQEKLSLDYYLSKECKKEIENANWELISERRRIMWDRFDNFSKLNDLTPVFERLHSESSPWAFPVYARNIEQRNQWLKWGVKNKIPVFSWPALPTSEIENNEAALQRWERMLCFPLNVLLTKEEIERL
jgi:perosamine synthetase